MKKLLLLIAALGLFAIPQFAEAQNTFLADAKIKVVSNIALANTTAIVLKPTAGSVYSIDAFNNGTAIAYIKLYNAATATCGSGTPQARYMVPIGASSSGGGFNASNINGDAYGLGIVMCITGGIADNNTTNPAASSVIVNVHLK